MAVLKDFNEIINNGEIHNILINMRMDIKFKKFDLQLINLDIFTSMLIPTTALSIFTMSLFGFFSKSKLAMVTMVRPIIEFALVAVATHLVRSWI